jgi:SAM-dependent methyltransferase
MVQIHNYDEIGVGYSTTRQPDPRIAAQIDRALGESNSLVNVGAGTGSYEPRDRRVIAVEPSARMISQRPSDSAPAIQATAERLPLHDNSVDAALAILTVHHWTDPQLGIAQMLRVARNRVVILTWDQSVWESFWLFRDYLPVACEFDRRRAVAISEIETALGASQISTVSIPRDCVDGFHGAFWQRPDAYLDRRVRAGISTYAEMSSNEFEDGLKRLAADIQNGAWEKKYRQLLELDELDLGYRIIVSEDTSISIVGV